MYKRGDVVDLYHFISSGFWVFPKSIICLSPFPSYKSIDSLQPIFTGMTTEQLEELGERILDAESLDQIRGWADEMRKRG